MQGIPDLGILRCRSGSGRKEFQLSVLLGPGRAESGCIWEEKFWEDRQTQMDGQTDRGQCITPEDGRAAAPWSVAFIERYHSGS